MEEIIGDFVEFGEDKGIESLVLRFLPGSISLQRRWRNNGLSADFLADYATTFFPKVEDDPQSGARQHDIKGAISYIANELLENAMKYCDDRLPYPILIGLQLDEVRVVFNEVNSVNAEQALVFRAFIQRMMATDPGEMFVAQMEASAEGGATSGLGLLTMINDYGARLSWRFQPQGDGAVTITTQVQLDI